MKKILACVDGSSCSDSVCDHAAWLSDRLEAEVVLLTVLHYGHDNASHADLSGAIGVGARRDILDHLTVEDETRGQQELRKGREILDHAEERLRASGVKEITTLKKRGVLAEAICGLEEDIDIIIIGKRGELSDNDSSHLVANLEPVSRAVHRPLMVTPGIFSPVEKFLIAFDGEASSIKALEYVLHDPFLKGLECHVVTVGCVTDGGERVLGEAVEKLQNAGFDVHSSLETGQPYEAIHAYVDANNIGLLLSGAYGHSRIRNLIKGSATTSMITSCKIPLLLFR